MENTSGQGSAAVIPPEIAGWNWGAMLMNWIWGLGNRTFIALLMFIPFVNFVMFFVLGAKGNEWAWRNKKWDSVEHFQRVQRKWTQVSLALIAAFVLLMVGVFFIATQTMKNSDAYQQAVTRLNANAQAQEALGAPVSTGRPSGSLSTSGGAGKAELSFEASGSKAKGTVYVEADQQAGAWTYGKIELAVEGRPDRIDLMSGGTAAAAAAGAPVAAAASGSGARFGKIVIADEKNATESDESFESGAARIYARVEMMDVPVGAKVSAVWVAVSVKDVAPEFVVATTDVTLKEEVTHGNFDIAKPEGGWPVGKYRLDLLVDGKKLSSASFKVE